MEKLTINPVRTSHVRWLTLSLTMLAVLAGCVSGGTDKVKPGTKVQLRCVDGKAIRFHYDPESGELTEKGPVLIDKSTTCSKAEDLDEKAMLKLQRDGDWVGLYKGTTAILWKGKYVKNKREGVLEYYDQKGTPGKRITYKEGKKEGPEEGVFKSGATRYKGQNADDKKTGMWEERFAEDSDCVARGAYTADEKTGPWDECKQDEESKKWYRNFHGSYAHGLKDGPAEEYHPSGSPSGKGNYRADLACKEKPPSEGVEACGKKTGRWVYLAPNGNTTAEGEYDPATGKRKGNWTEYYASGEKMGMGPRNHTRDGLWTFYGKDGQILGQYKFKGNDFMPNVCVVFEKGVKKEEGNCMSALVKYEPKEDILKINPFLRSGEWKGYHPNGSKAWEGGFNLKMKQGKWKYYSEGGAVLSEGSYNMDKKQGFWTETENGRTMTVEYDDFGRRKK